MREYESRALDVLRSPRALLAAVAVVAIFGLAVWVSPIAAAVVVAPLALFVAIAAAPNQTATQARETVRANISAGLDRQARNGRKLSILDPYTALLERWYFELRVTDEARRCRRYGMAMSMLFITIDEEDGQKDDPDRNTEVQMDFVQVLARSLRAVDLASRIGEREFALCLPHTPVDGALTLAWRVSQNVASYNVVMRRALAPDDGFDFDTLYEKAEVFTPSEPAPKSVEEPSSHLELVKLVKSAPYGEIAIREGESVRNTKTKLRRASKGAGVDLRIWDEDGAIHFERLASAQHRGAA
jgi:diguanylate cyclase (GGDEF)-like protein